MPDGTEQAEKVAEKVVERLTVSDQAIPVAPMGPIRTIREPNQPPMSVTATNIAKPGSAAWWFEKGGTVGIVCFLLIGTIVWMGNSQRESQSAVIKMMTDSQAASREDSKALTSGLMKTQVEISTNLARMARSMERVEAKLDAKKGPDE